jgi:hypothetical protein
MTGSKALFCCIVLASACSVSVAQAADDPTFFETRIRPVLVTHCYECHSAGAGKAEGQLVLDHRDGLRRGGESGPALVAGNPADSLILQALRHDGLKMPPTGPLPAAVVADFERWIRDGALDPRDHPPSPREAAREAWQAKLAERSQWWSLQPLQFVEPPAGTDATWAAHEIDRFVRAKLAAEQLSPAPPADADTLLRRLALVLTGLPPTPHQWSTFRAAYAADADGAVEQLVDQLLASPHFGERFARHWMDVVRYTDTYGYEWDNPAKGSWEYRDYLIRAFNQDLGWDQFLREQLAGDLLETPRVDPVLHLNESLIGPFFYHMGEHRHGSSLDFNGIHQEMIDNKIDAFSKAFLGFTVACARCHDHKLDAISQADYYALAGMFMTPRWTARDLAAPEKDAAILNELKRLRSEIRQTLSQSWSDYLSSADRPLGGVALRTWARAHQAELMTARKDSIAYPLAQLLRSDVWLPVQQITARARDTGTHFKVLEEGQVLAEGATPESDTYTIELTSGPGTASFIRLEALPHASLGGGGPGRTPHGNFVLTHIRVQVQPFGEPIAGTAGGRPNDAANSAPEPTASGSQAGVTGGPALPRDVKLVSASADFSQVNYPVSAALDPASSTGWGVGGVTPINVPRTARFQFAEPILLPHGGRWTITLEQRYGSQHLLGHFRLAPGGDAFEQSSPGSREAANQDAGPPPAEPLDNTPHGSKSTELASAQAVALELQARWQRLADEWSRQREQRQKNNESRFLLLSDFRTSALPAGWSTDGQGFAHGYVEEGTPRIDPMGKTLIAEFLPRGLHSHALSSKLPGAIRLPQPDRFPRKHVSLKIAGGDWAGRIDVPQNAFQTESITFFEGTNPATWRAVAPVGLKNGVTRVLTEFSTASLHPNFPPRTGLARAGSQRLPDTDLGYQKRSWLSLTGIVAHDSGGAPEETLDAFTELYTYDEARELPGSATETWDRLATWLNGAVERWIRSETTTADVPILNWLLQNQLLPNDAERLPEVASLVESYRRTEAQLGFPHTSISMDERHVEPINYRLNRRGNVDDESEAVPRGFLEVFGSLTPRPSADSRPPADSLGTVSNTRALAVGGGSTTTRTTTNTSASSSAAITSPRSQDTTRWVGKRLAEGGSGRIELAEFLTRPDHPLTTRVYVNRVWHWVFGTGIVKTPNDFGKLGDPPSHPELLDWLAIRFTQENGSTKQLIRHLVLSQTFRQSGKVDPRAAERDPQNRLLHHYPTRRLEAEAIRDSLLAVSGQLDPRLYGRPINPPRVAQDSAKRLFAGPWDSDGRRSLYIQMSIMEPPKFLVGFNLPDLKLPTGRRDQTNVPAQALLMLNDPLVNRLADAWAGRLLRDGSTTPHERISRMFITVLSREATPDELERWTAAAEMFANAPADVMQDRQVWKELAHALFNTQEFLHYR